MKILVRFMPFVMVLDYLKRALPEHQFVTVGLHSLRQPNHGFSMVIHRWGPPNDESVELVREFRAKFPRFPVVVLTDHPEQTRQFADELRVSIFSTRSHDLNDRRHWEQCFREANRLAIQN